MLLIVNSFLLVLIFLMAGCRSVSQSGEAAWQVVNAMDAMQTAKLRDAPCLEETMWPTDKIIGKNPSKGETAAFFLATAILHAAITRALEDREGRQRVWLAVTLASSGGVVWRNRQRGIPVFGGVRKSVAQGCW